MKRKDLLVVVGVGVVAAIIALIISGAVFGSPKKNPIKVPVVNKISSEFPSPKTDENYQKFFNNQANNPTQLIQIGGTSNTTPFNNGNGQ